MKFNQLLFRFLAFAAFVLFLQACVEDDDFDTPEIPPIQEIQEIISEGGLNASFEGCFSEDFESYDQDQTSFGMYENVTTLNTRLWEVNEFAGNQYLRMSAYQATGDVISYFVVPVNFDEADSFSFKTQDRFSNGDPLEVYLVTDYQISGNIAEANTTEITDQFTIATGNTESNTTPFVSSGSYDLSAQTGNGFIAFKYVGNGSGISTTMHIDDIEIVDNDDDDCESDGGGSSAGNVGGGDASPQSCLEENFEDIAVDTDVFGAYESAAVVGDRYWNVREFGGNQYLQMSAFNGNGDYDSWILVNVDFDKADTFAFKSKDGFNNGEALTVLYSTDHTVGAEITPSEWTDITSGFTIATGTTSGYADNFTESGAYDLSSIEGTGFVAFRYKGNSSGTTTTMQIDDITIIDNEDANCELGGGGEEACSAQNFEEFTNEQTNLPGYQHIATTGDLNWNVREFSDNKYIQMSAFSGNGGNGEHVAWFIAGVNFDQATGISFDTKDGFNNGDPLTVWYATDYDEMGDPTSATWTDITNQFTIATGTTSGFADAFTPSGTYNFDGLSGNGYIAFRYEGNSDGGITTTLQVDNIAVYGTGTCTFDLQEIGGGGSGQMHQGGQDAMPEDCAMENFEDYAENTTEFPLYEGIAVQGDRFWEVREFGGNQYLQMSAFNGSGDHESWILFNVDFDNADNFSFKSKDGFNNGDALSVWYSTSHTVGDDIDVTNWTDITSEFTLATGSSSGYADDFTESGDYALSGLSGSGFIAFRYMGNSDGTTTTFQIDDVTITNTDDPDCNGGGGGSGQMHQGGEDAMPEDCAIENFEDYTENTTEFPLYEGIAVEGDRFWEVREFGGNQYLQMSAFDGTGNYDTWVLFNVDFDNADNFSFKSKDGFNNGDALSVWYSTSHTVGDDIDVTNWTDITSEFTLATGSSSGYADDFTESGDYALSGLSGTGFIAFRYMGNSDGVTTTFQVDDVKISTTDDPDCNGGGGGTEFEGRINEFHYDDVDGDDGEFVEVRITGGEGDQPTNLGDYLIILYNGNNGNSYSQESLTSLTRTCADGFCYYVWEPSSIQNGAPDGIAFVGPDGVIDFVSYEGSFTANDGEAQGAESTDVGAEESNSSPEGSSIQLNDAGTEWAYTEGTNTKGEANDLDGGGGGTETTLNINEIHYDDIDGDDGEFLEIRISGGESDQPTNLGDYVVVLYNGNNGNSYNSENLSNLTRTCADGYCYYVWEPSSIQNGGPDGIALVGPDGVIEFVSYEGTFTANDGEAQGAESVDIGVEETNSTTEGSSLQLKIDGSEWFVSEGSNTKGAVNSQ